MFQVSGLTAGEGLSLEWFFSADEDDLNASGMLVVQSLTETSAVLDLMLSNDSFEENTRLTAFGLFADGASAADFATAGALLDGIEFEPNFPGFTIVNVCTFAGPNCAGGGNGGIDGGDTDQLSIVLTGIFDPSNGLTLAAFATKWQTEGQSYQLPASVEPKNGRVPEPTVLALMGLALTGAAILRRRS